ncbi:hypothetical protein [Halococcus sediminicola]|uniref:hypothetical protein n=1 Tax=Halococcus sediminicola TaxID=1264579 RepID=UPI0012ABFDDC|nr:hypothetical protein [Halococcus sediminicola]
MAEVNTEKVAEEIGNDADNELGRITAAIAEGAGFSHEALDALVFEALAVEAFGEDAVKRARRTVIKDLLENYVEDRVVGELEASRTPGTGAGIGGAVLTGSGVQTTAATAGALGGEDLDSYGTGVEGDDGRVSDVSKWQQQQALAAEAPTDPRLDAYGTGTERVGEDGTEVDTVDADHAEASERARLKANAKLIEQNERESAGSDDPEDYGTGVEKSGRGR